ncbi:MAG: hypothetical protein PVI21_02990 [Candidatus Woesebacteria bacterium]|jgi:hypothetical protein
MDVNPPQHQDMAGDDELAKVLAGVSDDPNQQAQSPAAAAGLQFEETPIPGAQPQSQTAAQPATAQTVAPAASPVEEPASAPAPAAPVVEQAPTATTGSGLDDIKRSALEELRPLVDKLNLPPEEKFDTLLLIIRSTDDQSLLPGAHEAAKSIQDEGKRAQALLDVIKEIDYFNQPQPQQ